MVLVQDQPKEDLMEELRDEGSAEATLPKKPPKPNTTMDGHKVAQLLPSLSSLLFPLLAQLINPDHHMWT
jgi:hypothetical protein